MSQTIIYRIPYLPDILMPKNIMRFGDSSNALNFLSSSIYEYIRVITSFFDFEDIIVTLRYDFNPHLTNQDRLKIFIILKIHEKKHIYHWVILSLKYLR